MDTKSLEVFLAVANKLSFVEVADEIGVNPSSISRTVSALEEEIGTRLFFRTTRQMKLTESGELFASQVSGILNELKCSIEASRDIHRALSGTLRVSASVAFGEKVIVPIVPEFLRRHPKINLELVFTDENLDLVKENVDLAVRLAPAIEKNLVVTRLFDTQYWLCASPEYLKQNKPISSPEDLLKNQVIQYSLSSFRERWLYRLQASRSEHNRINLDTQLVVSSPLSMLSLCINGAGIALMADWLVKEEVQQGILQRLLPEYDFAGHDFNTAAWVVYPDRQYVPQKVRVFIDFIKEMVSGN